jgi:hypothetical protein
MDQDALRLVIRGKLADGSLPADSISRICGGPGNGESCRACGGFVLPDQFVMEGISARDMILQFHVECFYLWDSERRHVPQSPG